tara:strand:- start:12556 stop:13608 length:1053 start_codon:yes stop_codon:yes gene_type:complete
MWDNDPKQPAGLVAIGLALITVGAVTSAWGMTLMRASKFLEQDRPWWKRPRLIVGISLATFINTILDTIAFACAPLALIAPLSGITIVSSVIFASMGCAGKREKVSIVQWVAIGVVVFGIVMVDVFGPKPDPILDTTWVLDRYHQSGWILYEVTTFVVVACTYIGIWTKRLGGADVETTIASAVSGGMASGITQNLIKFVSTVMAAYTITGELPFEHPDFWCAIVELIVVGLVLFHLLNVCLASATIAVATPLYLVCVIVCTIVASCAFYGDLDVVTRFELMMFTLGISAVMAGLFVLVIKRDNSHEERPVATDENAKGSKAPEPPEAMEAMEASADDVAHAKSDEGPDS